MNKIIRWYNQNRRRVWVTILVLIMLVGMSQVLNNYYKKNRSTKDENINSSMRNTTIYNDINYSVISEEEVPSGMQEDITGIIDEFIAACNNKEIEKAYDLLTDDCKEALFPEISDFENNYCSKVFNTSKRYSMQSWIIDNGKYTYMVEIKEDSLVTRTKTSFKYSRILHCEYI